MPAPFVVQPAPQRRMGYSGIFAVPDLSASLNPTDASGQKMEWSDILKPAPRDRIANLTVTALESIREQAKAAERAARGIHGDQTLGEAEKHRAAAKTTAELFLPCQPHIEKALGASSKAIAELEKILAGPDIELSDVRGIEIRSKLAGLEPDKRFAAISRAIARGDDSVMAALLGCDRLLIDFLSEPELETARSLWARTRHPDEVALREKRKSDLREPAHDGEDGA